MSTQSYQNPINWNDEYNSMFGNPSKSQGFKGTATSGLGVNASTNFNSGNQTGYDMGGEAEALKNLGILQRDRNSQYYQGGTTPFGKMGDAFGKLGITAPGIEAFGSAITGLGSLASGWAALKNIGIQKDALADSNRQYTQNYEAQRTTTNNQIANQNAFKKAQGRTDYGSYVGGKPSGTTYVG